MCVFLMKVRIHFIDGQTKVKAKEGHAQTLSQSDISYEEIKTSPVYEAHGETSCTIDKRSRLMELAGAGLCISSYMWRKCLYLLKIIL